MFPTMDLELVVWYALARVVWRLRVWIFVDLIGFSAGLN